MELRAVFVEDGALVEGSNLLGSLRANVVSGMVKCDHAEGVLQGAAQLPFCSSTETRTASSLAALPTAAAWLVNRHANSTALPFKQRSRIWSRWTRLNG